MTTLSCPKCRHELCNGCVRETWKRPVGTLRVEAHLDKYGEKRWNFSAEERLMCCACGTENEARHWPEKKIARPSERKTYPDMFVEGETKI